MTRVLLLEGPSGVGKSTMLLETLGPRLARAGGFMTRRLPGAARRGFCHVKPAALGQPTGNALTGREDGLFLTCGEDGVTRYDDVLLSHTLPMLEGIDRYPFAVLDEIGGFELVLPAFRDALYRAIDKPVPILGVLKCRVNSQNLSRRGHLPHAYQKEYEAFRHFLETHEEVAILRLEPGNGGDVRQSLAAWLEVYNA